MPDHFDYAVGVVLAHEGGYVDHPADPGGATNWGISLRWLRRMALAEGDVDGDDDIDADDIRMMPREQAVALYRRHWWARYGYDRFQDRDLAAKVFDLAVNMGARQAHRLLQRACRAAGAPVAEDGSLGPQTLSAVHSRPPTVLLTALRAEAAGFYRSLARPEFERGWLRRAYA